MKKLILENDSDNESPCEWGGWKLYSFSRKHTSYKDPDEFISVVNGEVIPNTIGLRRQLDVGTAFILSYFEHGQCRWSLKGEGHQCQFDSVRIAGILIWEGKVKDLNKNLGVKTYADRQLNARSFCDIYTQWCNGEIYYYCVEDEEGEVIDDCGGWYGSEAKTMAESIRVAIGDDTEVEITGDAAWLARYHDFIPKSRSVTDLAGT